MRLPLPSAVVSSASAFQEPMSLQSKAAGHDGDLVRLLHHGVVDGNVGDLLEGLGRQHRRRHLVEIGGGERGLDGGRAGPAHGYAGRRSGRRR